MNGFLDWREIELQNDWGLREKSDAMGERWNDGAAMWDSRWKKDLDFTKSQADALSFEPDDTVLDIGCGTGPLTLFIAPRVKRVIAMDYGRDMLRILEENARERGIHNITTLQGNWYSMEPGDELPICDVAITRWSPAHGDILKFSRCARRWCWSVSSVPLTFAEEGAARDGYWCRSTVDESLNTTSRPCGRKYGLNVHFNLLYDHGANPTLNYLKKERVMTADTREELVSKLMPPQRKDTSRTAEEEVRARTMAEMLFASNISQQEDGSWRFARTETIAIMGWDPREIYC